MSEQQEPQEETVKELVDLSTAHAAQLSKLLTKLGEKIDAQSLRFFVRAKLKDDDKAFSVHILSADGEASKVEYLGDVDQGAQVNEFNRSLAARVVEKDVRQKRLYGARIIEQIQEITADQYRNALGEYGGPASLNQWAASFTHFKGLTVFSAVNNLKARSKLVHDLLEMTSKNDGLRVSLHKGLSSGAAFSIKFHWTTPEGMDTDMPCAIEFTQAEIEPGVFKTLWLDDKGLPASKVYKLSRAADEYIKSDRTAPVEFPGGSFEI